MLLAMLHLSLLLLLLLLVGLVLGFDVHRIGVCCGRPDCLLPHHALLPFP